MPQIPSFDGDYHTANWRGTFSTWHGFVVPDSVSPGGYPLEVSIGPTGGPYLSQIVGWLDVSYLKIEDPPAGAVLTQNGQALLRLSTVDIRLSDIMALDLSWRAEASIASDLSYFVHITPADSEAPVAQLDSRPYNGTYPTFLWQQGEAIPIHVVLNALPAMAGEYDVYFGWYTPPNGPRLITENGVDRLRLARFVVNQDGSAIISQLFPLDEMS
jgi:hypothetical protein